MLLTGAPPWQRLVEYFGRPPSKGWITQMEEHEYSNPETLGSSPGPVQFSLPIFQIVYYFGVDFGKALSSRVCFT